MKNNEPFPDAEANKREFVDVTGDVLQVFTANERFIYLYNIDEVTEIELTLERARELGEYLIKLSEGNQ